MTGPKRIVCLSAESADWLARLGAWERVVGVTACYRPASGLSPKPRVGGFSSVKVESILALDPDLVIVFSDVQAGVAARLIAEGCNVYALNPRRLADVEESLRQLARLVGAAAEGEKLLDEFRERMRARPALPRRVRVYFEEWDDPCIAGIGWISEMIERAGGEDVFARLARCKSARARVVTDEAVRAADPEVILASWCGKPTVVERILDRPGWSEVTAVRQRTVFTVEPDVFLQPGYRLMEGYELLRRILETAASRG